ncbi:GNAT family N-acetyltransferase [Rhodoferax sp. GW822-FHT02A01]|uniref:GNAT family N-acetyltransferase n=1 Tax=Rhodoferax sp. GW822-FHT02A01 TaxID=3141537 RepID=UPI00315D0C1D
MVEPGVDVLHSFEELRVALRARGLCPQAAPESADVFCTLPWLENLAAHGLPFPTTAADCRLLLTGSDKHLAVCLPLLAHGSNWTSLSNYYSSLFSPLCWPSPDRDSECAQAPESADSGYCLRALCASLRAARQRPTMLTLSPLDKDDRQFQALQDALRAAGYWVDTFYCFGNWYFPVRGQTFAAYLAALPSALRHSMDRGQRRLTRAGPWNLRIQCAQPASLEQAIADFVQVYNHSWKQPEPLPDFIPQMARMAAAQGWLRLGVLSLNGDPIAAQLWLIKDGKANIYKLAYKQGFERYSAGSLLTKAMMEHVFNIDRVLEVDYLTGDDGYKQDWMSQRRERWGIVAFEPRSLRGLAQAGRHWLARQFRHWRHT